MHCVKSLCYSFFPALEEVLLEQASVRAALARGDSPSMQ